MHDFAATREALAPLHRPTIPYPMPPHRSGRRLSVRRRRRPLPPRPVARW